LFDTPIVDPLEPELLVFFELDAAVAWPPLLPQPATTSATRGIRTTRMRRECGLLRVMLCSLLDVVVYAAEHPVAQAFV
jgi:hypothetical protein